MLAIVTKTYEQLAERPRTGIRVSRLHPDERAELRRIKLQLSSDVTNKGDSGDFTTVYYLDGDEQRAAEVFVDENRAALEGIDFSKKNLVQQGVSREVYDWILHALGKRELEKYDSVIRETRPEGVTWVIARDHFDAYPMRRYSAGEQSVRIDQISLQNLYDRFERTITRSNLDAHDAVTGDVRYLLEYYRIAEGFVCDPVTTDGEMAIRKRTE